MTLHTIALLLAACTGNSQDDTGASADDKGRTSATTSTPTAQGCNPEFPIECKDGSCAISAEYCDGGAKPIK